MESIINATFLVQQFIYKEQRCIDEKRWNDWLDLFSDDAEYWIPLDNSDESPGQSLSIVYETKIGMELRCRRYAHPLLHAQNPPSRTAHSSANIMLDHIDEEKNSYVVHAQFTMHEYRLNTQKTWAGNMLYHLQKFGVNEFKIARKKVELIDTEGEMETINVLF